MPVLSPMALPQQGKTFAAKSPAIAYVASVEPWTYLTDYGTLTGVKLVIRLKATTGTVYARLYDVTGSAAVSNSTLSTASGTLTTLTSDLLTDITSGHVYRVEVGYAAGHAGAWKLVRLDVFKGTVS